MEPSEKINLLNIIKKTEQAIRRDDLRAMKDLSDKTVHSSTIYQDTYFLTIAVVVYSIAKIIERTRYQKYKDWNVFYKNVIKGLDGAKTHLEKDELKEFENDLKSIIQIVGKLETNLKKWIKFIVRKAKVQKGSRVHEHGVSLGRVADMLGVTEWEIMEYIGPSGISEVKLAKTKEVEDRIKLVRKIFKK